MPSAWPEQTADYICSLLPYRLTELDYIDLTGRTDVHICVPNAPRIKGIVPTQRMRYTGTTPWPQRTGGFFYLNEARDNAPIISSSIRFRVTNSPDPFSFETGRDLELCGLPWTMPLIYTNLSLTMCMLEDGPFTGGTRHRMRRLSAIIEKNSYTQYSRWNDPYTPLTIIFFNPFILISAVARSDFGCSKQRRTRSPWTLSDRCGSHHR